MDQGSALEANRRAFLPAEIPDHPVGARDLKYSPEMSRRPILVLIPGHKLQYFRLPTRVSYDQGSVLAVRVPWRAALPEVVPIN